MAESLDMDSPIWAARMWDGTFRISFRQLTQPSFEKSPFRLLLREAEGPFVGGAGFYCSPQSAAEIRPRRVDQMIVP